MSVSPAAARSVGNQSSPRHNLVGDRSGLDMTGPAHHGRNTERAFPVGVLFAPEGRRGGVGPGELVGPVISRVDHDRVVGDLQIVQRLQQFADVPSCSIIPSAYSLPGMPL